MNWDRVPLDETLKLLADRTRRRVVWRLRRADETSVSRLAADLADRGETRTDGGTIPDGSAELEVALRHVHLPRLADAGVIDYDPKAGTVEPTDRIETVAEVLALVSETVESED